MVINYCALDKLILYHCSPPPGTIDKLSDIFHHSALPALMLPLAVTA